MLAGAICGGLLDHNEYRKKSLDGKCYCGRTNQEGNIKLVKDCSCYLCKWTQEDCAWYNVEYLIPLAVASLVPVFFAGPVKACSATLGGVVSSSVLSTVTVLNGYNRYNLNKHYCPAHYINRRIVFDFLDEGGHLEVEERTLSNGDKSTRRLCQLVKEVN